MAETKNRTFQTESKISVNNQNYKIFSLNALSKEKGVGDFSRLPYCLKVMLENLVRCEDGDTVTREDIIQLTQWDPKKEPDHEIAFRPARVLLQDFTGVPAVVDLAVMRDAMADMGADPSRINPLQPADLVIDHSVQIDEFGSREAIGANTKREYERNEERYSFLRWGQTALKDFQVVPPETGIVHQVNLEYLAHGVFSTTQNGEKVAYPDTLVGTDSHTTMINGLGVVGWGVGGIEAEAAMLGQPISLLVPQVIGFKLEGKLKTGVTATDLVLTVVQMLRKKGVVGKFVEFYGHGMSSLSLADRATIANMGPEYGATIGFFPVDQETVNYLRFTNREERANLVEAYCKEQGLFFDPSFEPTYTDTLQLDLTTVEPSIAGPKRPQDRILLKEAKAKWKQTLPELLGTAKADAQLSVQGKYGNYEIGHGAVAIASITSCTNTSNPSVMLGAGLLAKKAVEKGLMVKPWVKTSLAPGSKVVTDYLEAAGLIESLEALRFHVVAYGCTTCIGNSGPLPKEVSDAVTEGDLVVTSVLSGNRNFEGRINPHVKANYLASPPLVVAYAIAGRMDLDLTTEPLGTGKDGRPVYLKDIWPSQEEITEAIRTSHKKSQYEKEYSNVFAGAKEWQSLSYPKGERYQWDEKSTYVKKPPFFKNMKREPDPVQDIVGARCLVKLGDSVTTDHISPAGSFNTKSPAGKYLMSLGVEQVDFNSYGSRRGNHEVMMRGTFANIRLKNQLAPGTEGSATTHFPSGEQLSIYDAAMKYEKEQVPLVILAGKEYGTGSSRDWAAKGTALLGVDAVIAESFERIHRSNLIGMGVLPLEFLPGDSHASLGLTGKEIFTIAGIKGGFKPRGRFKVEAKSGDGSVKTFETLCRIDTQNEYRYYENGGILHYVLRQLVSQ